VIAREPHHCPLPADPLRRFAGRLLAGLRAQRRRLDAANARTKAAEARIRASEGQSPWQSQGGADSATHETINNDSAPGAPMLDPAPVAPPQATGANLPPTRLPPGAIVN